jgi:hypothetical protein
MKGVEYIPGSLSDDSLVWLNLNIWAFSTLNSNVVGDAQILRAL